MEKQKYIFNSSMPWNNTQKSYFPTLTVNEQDGNQNIL